MERRRLAPLFLLGTALIATLFFSERWPEDHTIHYVLGDRAPGVEEVDARWTAAASPNEPLCEVSFRCARGSAPRVLTHEPRLARGDYAVDVDVVAYGQRTHVVRHVTLGGGVTSIDVSGGDAVGGRNAGSEAPRVTSK